MTMLPSASSATGAAVTEGGFKTFITSLRAFLYEKLGDDGSVPIQNFPSGTRLLFQQTSAPTGWTKDTTHNDKALRVVSGTVGGGGSVAFSTVFGRQATDGHTLTTAEMPSHSHSYTINQGSFGGGYGWATWSYNTTGGDVQVTATSTSAGSGGAHAHNIDLRVQYVDIIVAQKD